MYQNFIGIDIAKNSFVSAVHHSQSVKTYENNLSGFSQFYDDHSKYLPEALIILETTGGYEINIIRFLQQHKCKVHRANTRKVKHFIRSFGQLGKSDAIDALALATYGVERHKSLELFKENPRKRLLKLVLRRTELKRMLVQEKNRLKAPDLHELTESFEIVIKTLEEQLSVIDQQINGICGADSQLSIQLAALKTLPGIADITAFSLLAVLPELGTVNRKQIASLAGVAPHPNESGNKVGYRFTRGGRSEVKPILFMAAMSAAHSKSELGEFYAKLLKAGKKKMVALVAVMRKMVVIANARVRDAVLESKI